MHVLFPTYLHTLGIPPPSAIAIDIGALSDQQEVWLPTLPQRWRNCLTSLLIRYAFKLFWGSENSVVSIASRLWAEWSEVQIPAEARRFLQIFKTGSGTCQASFFYRYWCSFHVVQRPGREVDNHHYLSLWLRMSGPIPLLLVCLDGLDRDVLILVCSSTSVLWLRYNAGAQNYAECWVIGTWNF
jgi:hypothetical protein